MTSLSISEAAAQSIVDQADYYAERAGADLATRWNDGVISTLRLILKFPKIAARRSWNADALCGLRALVVDGFPNHFVFYFFEDRDGLVRIVHVLHGARDLESILGETITTDENGESD